MSLIRRYRPVEGYHSANDLNGVFLEWSGTEPDQVSMDEIAYYFTSVAPVIIQYGSPLWWIGADLCADILNTEPPAGLTLDQIPWPMPAVTCLVPLSSGLRLYSKPVVAISAVRKIWLESDGREFEMATFIAFTRKQDGVLSFSLFHLRMGATYQEAVAVLGESLEANRDVAIQVIINAIAILSARPELIEAETVEKRIKNKAEGGKVDLYGPRWLGRI